MFTRCIQCQTIYRIDANALRSGRGEAICTRCSIIFGALENLGETPQEAAEDHSSCILELPELGDNEAVTDLTEQPESAGQKPTDAQSTVPPRADKARVPPEQAAPKMQVEQEPQIKPFDPEVLLSMGAKREAQATEDEARAKLYRGIATAALALLLVVQLFVYEKDNLAQNPRIRPWLENLCGVFGCQLPPFRNLSEIAVVDRALYPAKNNSLEGYQFHLVIVNHAPYAQPYPLIKLNFTALDGSPIASRIFKPQEYLPSDHPPLMPSHQLVFIDLNLLAPSQPVGGFNFEFLH